MNLDEAQKQKVAAWIAEGTKLSDIQSRLASEFGVRLTYMEVRLLVDDLKLTPKDPEPSTASDTTATVPGAPTGPAPGEEAPLPGEGGAGFGNLSVKVDAITRPGSLVSGSVTFSDGMKAEWYLDQMGRLGLVPAQPGYRPSPDDVQAFQMELQNELQKMGM